MATYAPKLRLSTAAFVVRFLSQSDSSFVLSNISHEKGDDTCTRDVANDIDSGRADRARLGQELQGRAPTDKENSSRKKSLETFFVFVVCGLK